MLFQSYSNGKVYFKDSSDILDLDKLSEDGVLSIDADTPKKYRMDGSFGICR